MTTHSSTSAAPNSTNDTGNGVAVASAAVPTSSSTAAPAGGASVRYDVLEREGEGTLWVCYRVRDRASGLPCALKALKSTFARHPGFSLALLKRLQHEASLRAPGQTLPSLAAVYEAGLEEGTPYFVSDWIPSSTLEAVLDKSARRPLNRSQILSLVRSIAQALEFLHQNGLAHGDIRPRQVRLMGDGSAKLCDSAHATALHEANVQLSDVIGDAAFYQAPERWDNRPPSPSADLYALGVVLYRMLAGRVPFEGTSPLAIAMRHRRDVPLKPSQFNAQCPRDLEAIALRLLEKDPQSRYVSAAHLLRDLAAPAAPAATPSTSARPALAPDPGAALPDTASTSNISASTLAAPLAAPVAVAAAVAAPAMAPVVDDDEDSDEEEIKRAEKLARRKHRRREFWGMVGAFVWMLTVGGALGGMVWGAYHFWVSDIPREVRVPEYRGKSQDAVESILAKRGLKFRVAREVYDPKRPSGTVLSGEPSPGKAVRLGREIAGTVSRGPEPIRMYDFSELTLQQARAVVVRDGLRLGLVMEQYHDTVPAGYICGQFPEPTEVFRRTDPINLVVSRGPQPGISAPDPDGLPPLEQPTPPSESAQPEAPMAANDGSNEALVQRVVQVRVAIPRDASAQEVRVVARDADGERTVYKRTHQPGDVVQESVQVTRAQGATALVRIFVGGALFRELRV